MIVTELISKSIPEGRGDFFDCILVISHGWEVRNLHNFRLLYGTASLSFRLDNPPNCCVHFASRFLIYCSNTNTYFYLVWDRTFRRAALDYANVDYRNFLAWTDFPAHDSLQPDDCAGSHDNRVNRGVRKGSVTSSPKDGGFQRVGSCEYWALHECQLGQPFARLRAGIKRNLEWEHESTDLHRP